MLGLESRTRVIEAPTPNQALWDPKRIIAIAPGVCLEITLDPNDSEAIPKFLFLGPENKIIPLIKSMSDNVHKYDSERPLAENLERILEIELPLPLINGWNQNLLSSSISIFGFGYNNLSRE